jgi:hypothetical protein
MMPPRGLASLALAILLFPARTLAQADADQVPRARTVTTAEVVDAEMKNARLLLGPMRVYPMIVVTNAGWDSNVFSRPEGGDEPIVGDWTVTAGAGARALLPMGKKLYLRLLAVPQYIWYDALVERRTWGGDFGASFLALGNRLQFEATGALDRGTGVLSSETQRIVISTKGRVGGKLEVDLTRVLSFVGAAEWEKFDYLPAADDPVNPIGVTQYNRTETAALAGLRFRLTPSLFLTTGVQGTRTEFVELADLRDNQTYALLGGLQFNRERVFVNLAGGYRKGHALENNLFDYQTAVGSAFVSFRVAGPLELQAFAHRRPVYSRAALEQLYFENRYGGGVLVRIGSRISLGGSAETGTNVYPFNVLGEDTQRETDALSYGGTLSLRVLDRVVIRANALQTELRPLGGTTERRVFRFWTGLSFNGEYTRE